MKKKITILIYIFFIGINTISAKETVKFIDCVDGDTIKISLDNKDYTVRMLAIDTPESVHPNKPVEYYGKEASDYTCNKVKTAKKLEIEYDENSEKLDKYDRLLVWVFTEGKLLQKDLVEKGYAKVAYLYDDYKYTNELEKVQELASANNLGIWNEEEKKLYNENNNIKEEIEEKDDIDNKNAIKESGDYSTKDIIIIGILLLIIVFVGDKTIKNTAKKKLKKYLK